MRADEKMICESVFAKAEIVEKSEYNCEGIKVETYEVMYLGEKYIMTKNDGEWVYFLHEIN